MSNTTIAAHEYWGYLIKPDKSPTPIFEQLLLGVANYINHHVAPWDVHSLTPVKLAAFYRLVGGDYDALFLDTPESSLSFIYQSLGCFHSLQPDQHPYKAPTIPALTPQGFVRWQTVQLLLGPEEHVPFLQDAVKRFDLLNPTDGIPFPSILPKEALPMYPDPELSEWHDTVTQKLMLEAQASAARDLPPRPQMALSDVDLQSSRDSSVDSHSVAGTDLTGYCARPRPRVPYRYPVYQPARVPQPPPQYSDGAPWSSQRRRSSLPDDNAGYSAASPRDVRIATHAPPTRTVRPHLHHRDPSDLSTISTSTSDTSSVTSSAVSTSPVHYHSRPQPQHPAARRLSADFPPQRPLSHPQSYPARERRSSGPSAQRNIRWQDQDDIYAFDPRSAQCNLRPDRDLGYGYSHGDRRFEERGRGRSARDVDLDRNSAGRTHTWR